MTKLTSTPAGAVLVAIDMSKNRQEVLIERPEGGRRRRMTVMATRQDYDGLVEQLAAIGRPIVVGFEATGNYHRTLAHRLLTAGSSCGSSHRSPSPERVRRCTTAGTRTTPRARRSSCTCCGSPAILPCAAGYRS